jgi:hypothetical protein
MFSSAAFIAPAERRPHAVHRSSMRIFNRLSACSVSRRRVSARRNRAPFTVPLSPFAPSRSHFVALRHPTSPAHLWKSFWHADRFSLAPGREECRDSAPQSHPPV